MCHVDGEKRRAANPIINKIEFLIALSPSPRPGKRISGIAPDQELKSNERPWKRGNVRLIKLGSASERKYQRQSR